MMRPFFFASLLFLPVMAHAQPAPLPTAGGCPTPAPCKVLTLTPEEEQALLGPKMILDTAETGRPLDLLGVVRYFRDKIASAPKGAPPTIAGDQPAPQLPAPAPAPEIE